MKTVIDCHLSLFLHLKLQFSAPFAQCVSAQYVQFAISSVYSIMQYGPAQLMKMNRIQGPLISHWLKADGSANVAALAISLGAHFYHFMPVVAASKERAAAMRL